MIDLDQNEHIVYVARKHWFFFVLETFSLFLFIVAPFVLLPYFAKTGSSLVVFYGATLWGVLLFIILAYVWTDYYLDVWVVTNKRLIDVDQNGLFRRKMSSTRLDLIQDITIEIPGFLATFSGYGDIHMQTAGESQEFVFKNVARPEVLKETILRESGQFREQMLVSRHASIAGTQAPRPPT